MQLQKQLQIVGDLTQNGELLTNALNPFVVYEAGMCVTLEKQSGNVFFPD